MGCANSKAAEAKDTRLHPEMLPVATDEDDSNYYVAPSAKNNGAPNTQDCEVMTGSSRPTAEDVTSGNNTAALTNNNKPLKGRHGILTNPNNPYLRDSFGYIPAEVLQGGTTRSRRCRVTPTIRTDGARPSQEEGAGGQASAASPTSPATNYYYRPPTTALTADSGGQSCFMYAESSIDEIKAPREAYASLGDADGGIRREDEDEDEECEEDRERDDDEEDEESSSDLQQSGEGRSEGLQHEKFPMITTTQPQIASHNASLSHADVVPADGLTTHVHVPTGDAFGISHSPHQPDLFLGVADLHFTARGLSRRACRIESEHNLASSSYAADGGCPNNGWTTSRTLKRCTLSKANLTRNERQFAAATHQAETPSRHPSGDAIDAASPNADPNHDDDGNDGCRAALNRSEADATDILEDQMHEAEVEQKRQQQQHEGGMAARRQRGIPTSLSHCTFTSAYAEGCGITSVGDGDGRRSASRLHSMDTIHDHSNPLGAHSSAAGPLNSNDNNTSGIGGGAATLNSGPNTSRADHDGIATTTPTAKKSFAGWHFSNSYNHGPGGAVVSSANTSNAASPTHANVSAAVTSMGTHGAATTVASPNSRPQHGFFSIDASAPYMSRTRHESVQDWLMHIDVLASTEESVAEAEEEASGSGHAYNSPARSGEGTLAARLVGGQTASDTNVGSPITGGPMLRDVTLMGSGNDFVKAVADNWPKHVEVAVDSMTSSLLAQPAEVVGVAKGVGETVASQPTYNRRPSAYGQQGVTDDGVSIHSSSKAQSARQTSSSDPKVLIGVGAS